MRTRITLVLLALTFGFQSTASAFNWNGKTALHELDVSFGNMSTKSGHPLATFHGFHKAVFQAKSDPAKAAALKRVLKEDIDQLVDNDSDALQTVLFGNWLNEIRTNIDAEGTLALNLAAKLLRARYKKYLDGRVHSDRWAEDTRYTSSNYQHSMMVTSTDPAMQISQDDVYVLIQDYLDFALTTAIMNLAIATKGREDSSMSADDVDLSWVSGLRMVGSVFHIIEDSSVSCTDAAKQALAAKGKSCVVGDGHGIVKMTPEGLRVVSLSDNEFYERKVDDGSKPHAELDDLYRKELVDQVFGAFDPSFANADVLIGVVMGANDVVEATKGIPLFNPDGSTNDAFDAAAFSVSAQAARAIEEKVIVGRWAKKADRLPLPAVPGGDSEDKSDGEGSKGDGNTGGCAMGGHTTGAAAALVLAMIAMASRRRRR